jgi:cytochrome c-type biogenesis protein CcmH/NrfG
VGATSANTTAIAHLISDRLDKMPLVWQHQRSPFLHPLPVPNNSPRSMSVMEICRQQLTCLFLARRRYRIVSIVCDRGVPMETSHHPQHSSPLGVVLNLNCSGLGALLIVLFCTVFAAAQESASCHGCPALNSAQTAISPRLPIDLTIADNGPSAKRSGTQKLCSIQPFRGLAGLTSVDSLELPPKAQKEYGAACSALKSHRLAASEQHLRKAVQIAPKYVAGWVMLGQILEAQHQPDDARRACSQASQADPNYLPSYLCLAEIAGREERWDEVLRHTTRALELDPLHDPYAYFFSAIAYFNMNQLPEAEKRALKAEEIDRNHSEPMVQFLLAQIYEAKHNLTDAASHLREYLELAPDSAGADILKGHLAEIQDPK